KTRQSARKSLHESQPRPEPARVKRYALRFIEVAGSCSEDRGKDECENRQLRDRVQDRPQGAADAASVTIGKLSPDEAEEQAAACIEVCGNIRWHVLDGCLLSCRLEQGGVNTLAKPGDRGFIPFDAG